jgi:hypothetical protein
VIALGEVVIADRTELFADLLADLPQDVFGVLAFFADALDGCFDQHRVGEHRLVGFEDHGLLRVDAFADLAADLGEFFVG